MNKEESKQAWRKHVESGFSITFNQGQPLTGVLLGLSEPMGRTPGEGSPRALRTFLFEHRNLPVLSKPEGFVWTVYDKETQISYWGFGVCVDETLADEVSKAENAIRLDSLCQ